jgi:hypothetical protein
MSSESVCQVAHSWVDVGSFHTHLFGVVYVTMAIFMMEKRKEQRVCNKFCVNLGEMATETLKMIQQAFRDQILSHKQVCYNGMSGSTPVAHHFTMTNT